MKLIKADKRAAELIQKKFKFKSLKNALPYLGNPLNNGNNYCNSLF